MAKYPPKGAILESIVNDRLDWRTALGEFVDNAVDANARQVIIVVGRLKRGLPEFIRIEDDGEGCRDLIDMVRLGSHTDHKTTLLGRFGIGAKNAMLWIGGADSMVAIRSTHAGITRTLRLSWRAYAEEWEIREDSVREHPALDGERGTQITVRPSIRRFPEGDKLGRLQRELGYLYSSAIKKYGVQIQIRRAKGDPIVLKHWSLPPLTDVVEADVSVGHRTAHVFAGIVEPGTPNPKCGLTYVHGFRVIKPASALGCGGMDHSAICGRVELDRSWDLTKNKDDVSQRQDELGEAVFRVLQPMLMKASTRSSELQCSEFTEEVNRLLNETLKSNEDAKARRDKGGEKGSHEPKGTKRRQRRAAIEQDGLTFPSRSRGGLRVSYQNLGEPEEFGTHSEGQVVLNTAHPFLAHARLTQNASTIVLAALVVFGESQRSENAIGQRKIRFQSSGDLVKDIGRALSRSVSLDGSRVHEAGEAAE